MEKLKDKKAQTPLTADADAVELSEKELEAAAGGDNPFATGGPKVNTQPVV